MNVEWLLLLLLQELGSISAAIHGLVITVDMLLQEIDHDLVSHPIMADEGLPAVLGDVGATLHGTGEGRRRRQSRREVILEVLVAEMLVEGVLGGEHEIAEWALYLQGLIRHGHRRLYWLLLRLLLRLLYWWRMLLFLHLRLWMLLRGRRGR